MKITRGMFWINHRPKVHQQRSSMCSWNGYFLMLVYPLSYYFGSRLFLCARWLFVYLREYLRSINDIFGTDAMTPWRLKLLPWTVNWGAPATTIWVHPRHVPILNVAKHTHIAAFPNSPWRHYKSFDKLPRYSNEIHICSFQVEKPTTWN